MAQNTHIRTLLDTLGQGARSNKFLVNIAFPSVANGARPVLFDTLCKSVTLPGLAVQEVEKFHRGEKITLATRQELPGTFTCTFYDTETQLVRGTFLNWIRFIHDKNTGKVAAKSHADYMGEIAITQLTARGSVNDDKITTRLKYVFPKSVQDLEYSADANDVIQECTVTFQYSTQSLETTPGSFASNIDALGTVGDLLTSIGAPGILKTFNAATGAYDIVQDGTDLYNKGKSFLNTLKGLF